MAGERRWNRYQAPSQGRDETGAARTPAKKVIPPAAPSGSSRSTGSGARKGAKKSPDRSLRRGAILGLVALGAVLVIVLGFAFGRGGSDEPANDVEVETLAPAFVERGLETALTGLGGGEEPVSLRLDQYGMSVEYYDPNTRDRRTVEIRDYVDDGYSVDVRRNHFDSYDPRPFNLDVVTAEQLAGAVEDLLAKSSGANRWSVEVGYGVGEEPGRGLVMYVQTAGAETKSVTIPLEEAD